LKNWRKRQDQTACADNVCVCVCSTMHTVTSDILVLKLISVLVFILYSFFIVGEILQPSGGHVQGKVILITGMAPDLSYDNTRSE